MQIVGREAEQQFLQTVLKSKSPEFLAVYGRRRVGKTYLIREYFQKKSHYCEIIGKFKGSGEDQLASFAQGFTKAFSPDVPVANPQNWHAAFALLTTVVQKLPKSKKIVIFLDELPWLAKKRSDCLSALDYHWNSTWSQMPNLILIVCGSAASWILDKIINAKGGLHNRITRRLLLKPFNLSGTQAYLQAKKIKFSQKQVLDIYMIMGGVPYYLNQIDPGISAVQAVNQICFSASGLLVDEFNRLFTSLFGKSEVYIQITRLIAQYRYGIARTELLGKLNLASGGTFTKRINDLEAAGFIESYIPYGRSKKEQYYRITDEYTWFYFKWIEPAKQQTALIPNYWQLQAKTPAWYSWAGYSFESVCFRHIHQIYRALKLENINCKISNWRATGAQIDLLFDRDDDTITLCEIKYSQNKIPIDKALAKQLANKIEVFEQATKTQKQIHIAMITTNGIKPSIWSDDLVQQEVTLADLFTVPDRNEKT